MDGDDGAQAAGGVMEHVDAFMGVEGGVVEHGASGLQIGTNVTNGPGFRDRFPFGQSQLPVRTADAVFTGAVYAGDVGSAACPDTWLMTRLFSTILRLRAAPALAMARAGRLR